MKRKKQALNILKWTCHSLDLSNTEEHRERAIALAHEVSAYCNARSSSPCMCSLDAYGSLTVILHACVA